MSQAEKENHHQATAGFNTSVAKLLLTQYCHVHHKDSFIYILNWFKSV